MTKIFLAACSHIKSVVINSNVKPHYLLESFMDLRSNSKKTEEYVKWCLSADEFLLDSGAFAFMNKAKKVGKFTTEEINKYTKEYVNFINKYDIKYFFEMDLDCIYPYEKIKKARKWIEKHTNKKCIPVWHKSRGMDDFHEMCKEYNYVAIGGIASKEISPKDIDFITELCNIAHSYGCKIHGLGYLPLKTLNENKCPFDTVDGTGWQGHMRGQKFILENEKIIKVTDEELKNKIRNWKENETEGFENWTKFSIIKG